jgi:hypothetical protein
MHRCNLCVCHYTVGTTGTTGTLIQVVMIGSSLTVLHQLCHCILVTVMMLLLSLMEVIVHYVYTSVLKLGYYSLLVSQQHLTAVAIQ